MTVGEIDERVRQIMELSDDPEAAHGDEDSLHQDVLEFIANNAPEKWARLARAALKTQGIEFPRWCS